MSPSPAQPKVAFVAGANGVSGNAIIEYLIRRSKEEWSKIVVSSRSPLKSFWQDPRVHFIALDLSSSVEDVVKKLQPLCTDVTHAYFVSYVHSDDFTALKALNVPLFENFLHGIDTVAGDSLKSVCLQTGGKASHYGVHLGPPAEVPLHEGIPRYDDEGYNFYYPQEDLLFKIHAQRKWTWNVIRPMAIIGYTPSKNGMSEALTLALYILVCKELGEVPEFPGNEYFYNSVDDSSYAQGVADMTIWATTHPQTRNQAFNHINGDTFVWKYFFANLCKHFGAEAPIITDWPKGGDGNSKSKVLLETWAQDPRKKEAWDRVCDKFGGNKDTFAWGSWAFLDWVSQKTWPTLSSCAKARSFGWTRVDDTFSTWIETYRMFENAGILPPNHVTNPPIAAPGSVES
ncbi:uncharacterized protein A1O9_12582 [Exophiala aquamarina CBS 119918]|uniref:PRISE-like Rossmann-fold domain-containing protein n=1 Tax=Exophiala aquamarina CBS 119918 TaxID=1182545 RepID=A0A072NWL4_9EURO|nr:uncharacterized protein A1O9_12582 [Exophiala aquamarina CBS 119918]KEF51433.1 hypothetical protein A1O9_12582 [Exophiala aquamarina CBS 119918]